MAENETFGQRLARLRKKAGITQEKLAEILDVSYMTVRRWEWNKNAPRLDEAKNIAAALHVTEDELLNGVPEQNAWVLHIKIAGEQNEEEFIDMTKRVPVISSVTCTPNGPMLTLAGNWDLWLNAENMKNFFKQMKMARELVLDNGRKMGWVKDTEGEKKS